MKLVAVMVVIIAIWITAAQLVFGWQEANSSANTVFVEVQE